MATPWWTLLRRHWPWSNLHILASLPPPPMRAGSGGGCWCGGLHGLAPPEPHNGVLHKKRQIHNARHGGATTVVVRLPLSLSTILFSSRAAHSLSRSAMLLHFFGTHSALLFFGGRLGYVYSLTTTIPVSTDVSVTMVTSLLAWPGNRLPWCASLSSSCSRAVLAYLNAPVPILQNGWLPTHAPIKRPGLDPFPRH